MRPQLEAALAVLEHRLLLRVLQYPVQEAVVVDQMLIHTILRVLVVQEVVAAEERLPLQMVLTELQIPAAVVVEVLEVVDLTHHLAVTAAPVS
jgi:hypothetical protein